MTKILDEYHTNIPELIKELPRAHLDTKIKSKIFYAELNILDFNNKILSYEEKSKHLRGFSQYIPISEFPKITRDLSYSITMDENITELHQLIMRFKHDTLKEVFIFDYYDNKKADLIKIGYRFIFQSNEKTLTDHDVNEIISSLINKSLTISGIEIPGI